MHGIGLFTTRRQPRAMIRGHQLRMEAFDDDEILRHRPRRSARDLADGGHVEALFQEHFDPIVRAQVIVHRRQAMSRGPRDIRGLMPSSNFRQMIPLCVGELPMSST